MKELLRSCFLSDPNDSQELFAQNYHAMVESHLGFDLEADNVLWTYIQSFFKSHGHVPSIQTMRSHYTSVHETDVVDRLERLAMIKPRTRGDFLTYLEDKATVRRNKAVLDIAKDMAQIVTMGLPIKDTRGKETKLHGALDAVRYALDRSHSIVAPTLGGTMSGNIMTGAQGFVDRYERIEADPRYGTGYYCGVEQIDSMLKGAKKQELWVHAGFTGSLKSTFALHWAYIQAVYLGFSSVYFSLEMPYAQCENMLHAMHSAHEDFTEVRRKLLGEGIFGLDYQKIRDAQLTPNEKKFLIEYVVPSLNKGRVVPPHKYANGSTARDPSDYGDIHLEGLDKDKDTFTVTDLRARAELIFSKTPFQMIFVDHAGLMDARGRHPNTTERLNEVIKDLKRLAMNFNRGMGIAVVVLFQISRDGWRTAEKAGGRYNLTALSYANECAVRATPVLTDAGIAPIEAIEPGTRVWSRSGWKKVLHRFDQGRRRVWRIETVRGSVLEVTANHRVRVLREGEVAWCRARDLLAGDWVVGTRGDYPWAKQAPRFASGSPVSRMTPDLAYLLGAWDGDGRLRPQKIAFTGNRAEKTLRSVIGDKFSSVFGEKLLSYDFPSRPGAFDEESLANASRTAWFEKMAGPRGKKVPDTILRSPKQIVIAYLQGLWDTDGWINSANIVGLKMKSHDFLLQIQLLMTCLGYETTLNRTDTRLKATGRTYEGWTLRLLGYESRAQFQDELGFREPWKAGRLASSVEKAPEHKHTNQVYPVAELFLSVSRDHAPYACVTAGQLPVAHYRETVKARRRGVVTRQGILRLLRFLDLGGIRDSRAEKLRMLMENHVVQVRSSVDTGRLENVYDLEVTGDHEYQTGPILSHNCERSADIVTASWIDDDLRKENRAIMQCLKSRDQAPFDRTPVKIVFPQRRFITDHTMSIEEIDSKMKDARNAREGGSSNNTDYGGGGGRRSKPSKPAAVLDKDGNLDFNIE